MIEYLKRQWTSALMAIVCVLNTVRYSLTGEVLWAVLYAGCAGGLTTLLVVMFTLWREDRR